MKRLPLEKCGHFEWIGFYNVVEMLPSEGCE